MTTPSTVNTISPLVPTAAYDTYWYFAAERQRVFFQRLENPAGTLTHDPIIADFKFTNAYRASDRTSQFLIRRVIYRPDLPDAAFEVFFRIILFKLFNKIETWERLERECGPLTYSNYSYDRYDQTLTRVMESGNAVYSGAYIMPPADRVHTRKHQSHLRLLECMMEDSLADSIAAAPSMQSVFLLLKSYPGIGDFLAYQFAIDLNYSALTDFSESDFVVPGPGAIDGIRKCFAYAAGLSDVELIKFVTERQALEFARLGLEFRQLWGRPLQLIDCQNLFCEVDKYSRVRHPELTGKSGRARIKQRFAPRPSVPLPWYPPKWGLNDAICQHDYCSTEAQFALPISMDSSP